MIDKVSHISRLRGIAKGITARQIAEDDKLVYKALKTKIDKLEGELEYLRRDKLGRKNENKA